MRNSFFMDKIATGEPIYYSSLGEGKVSENYAIVILDKNNIYGGSINADGMKKGIGTYFVLKDRKDGNGWYYYEGEWDNDIPNGAGITTEEDILTNEDGSTYSAKVITEGTYLNGYENGLMHKYFYTDGQEDGNLTYTVYKGVPEPFLDENGQQITDENNRVAIGEIYYNGKPSKEYYYVGPGYKFNVKSYSKK